MTNILNDYDSEKGSVRLEEIKMVKNYSFLHTHIKTYIQKVIVYNFMQLLSNIYSGGQKSVDTC